MKNYYLYLFSAIIGSVVLLSCHKTDTATIQPKELFKKYVISDIPLGVRVFDSRSVNISPNEKTVWIAFDSTAKFWDAYSSSLNIIEVGYYLDYVSGNTPADTGFEGYLDEDYKTYGNDETKTGIFFVRKMPTGLLRIVFFNRES